MVARLMETASRKRNDIAGEIANLVTRIRLLRVAETALIEDKRMKPTGQQRYDPAEREPGVWPAMQKDDRFAIAIALFCIVDPWASC
jgi:hypothetical protein